MTRRIIALAAALFIAGGAAFGIAGPAPQAAEALMSECSGHTLHISWGGGAHSFYYDDMLCGGGGGGGEMHVGP